MKLKLALPVVLVLYHAVVLAPMYFAAAQDREQPPGGEDEAKKPVQATIEGTAFVMELEEAANSVTPIAQQEGEPQNPEQPKKAYKIRVIRATTDDGKLLYELAGDTLDVTGPKASELENYNLKTVIATGIVSADRKSFELKSLKEKRRQPREPESSETPPQPN